VRSFFIDKVDSFHLPSISFQKLGEVCCATSPQSIPSTPTRTAAGCQATASPYGSEDVAGMGYILFENEEKKQEFDQFVMGGCSVSDKSARFHCDSCGADYM
jgi:hypothetical protein